MISVMMLSLPMSDVIEYEKITSKKLYAKLWQWFYELIFNQPEFLYPVHVETIVH